jgi:esterase/lipase superfamily enzyme
LGWATVSVPKDHRLGDWEKPTIFTFRPKQAKNVLLLSATSLSAAEFVDRLRQRVQKSPKREAFIFVHGFNVSFNDAIQRTAILAYDLKFNGPAITFSWPSRAHLHAYLADEASIEFAIPDLERFISLVANTSGASQVHLIAHSMGSRALLRALANLRAQTHAPHNLSEVVFTAPDVDRDVFSQLVTSVVSIVRRVTLYGSSRDKALTLSHVVHDEARAGEGGARLFLSREIDSVDASAVDTGLVAHSYFGDNTSVITDMIELIGDALPPRARVCLSPHHRFALVYWVFDRCKK